jgi:hypothetical protein
MSDIDENELVAGPAAILEVHAADARALRHAMLDRWKGVSASAHGGLVRNSAAAMAGDDRGDDQGDDRDDDQGDDRGDDQGNDQDGGAQDVDIDFDENTDITQDDADQSDQSDQGDQGDRG